MGPQRVRHDWVTSLHFTSCTLHSRFLCNIALIASDFTSITSHIHKWVLFLLWLHLFILSGVLHWSPVACWAPTDVGSSSFSVLSFCLFILFMGFSRQEYWGDLPLPLPVDHIWSEYQTTLPASWETCMQVKKQQLELDMEQWTDSKLGKEYINAVYCHLAYLTYMQSTSCEMPGWMKHKLELRLQGEI